MDNKNSIVPVGNFDLKDMIYTIRGKQVMLDSDIAFLYQVSTKRLNEQVTRNKERFPESFMFQLTENEFENLRSQIATSSWNENGGNPTFQILRSQIATSKENENDEILTFQNLKSQIVISKEEGRGGRRYLPYVFTEQGIAMLSSVLKNEIAVKVSIKIMETFVEMRKFFVSNQTVFSRLDRVELKQLETDKKLTEVFDYIGATAEVKQHIFFNGQFYDAFSCIVDIIEKAKSKIVLIDNYVDTKTLNLLCKKKKAVEIVIITAGKGKLTADDINKFNSQYPKLTVTTRDDFHDRFLIIDDKTIYHIGASLKDVGKKTFGITKLEETGIIKTLLDRV